MGKKQSRWAFEEGEWQDPTENPSPCHPGSDCFCVISFSPQFSGPCCFIKELNRVGFHQQVSVFWPWQPFLPFGNFALWETTLASIVPWAVQYAAWSYLKPDALVTTNLLPLGVEKTEQGASFFLVSTVCLPPHVICTQPLGFLGLHTNSLSWTGPGAARAAKACSGHLWKPFPGQGSGAKAGQWVRQGGAARPCWSAGKTVVPREHTVPAGIGWKSPGWLLQCPALTTPATPPANIDYSDVALKLGEHWNLTPALGAETIGFICLSGFAKPSTGLQGSGLGGDTVSLSECAEA